MNTTTGKATKPMGWWDGGEIVGGKDEVGGGTWLAASKQGRLAFLTNVLELHTLPEAKTRGDLVIRFLESKKSPKAFGAELGKEANEYNGFNLIVADLVTKSMVYISNRPKGEPLSIEAVPSGIHVLSNAMLDSPWPKAERLETTFKLQLDRYGGGEIPVKELVEKLMRDTHRADENNLPNICPRDWELNLSSIFVEVDTPLGKYGTRSTAALTVRASGEASFYEIYLQGDEWKHHTLNYYIQKLLLIHPRPDRVLIIKGSVRYTFNSSCFPSIPNLPRVLVSCTNRPSYITKSRTRNRKCYNCNEPGHYDNKCDKPKKIKKKYENSSDNHANVAIDSENYGDVLMVSDMFSEPYVNSVSNSLSESEWLIDSGCTFDVSIEVEHLPVLSKLDKPDNVPEYDNLDHPEDGRDLNDLQDNPNENLDNSEEGRDSNVLQNYQLTRDRVRRTVRQPQRMKSDPWTREFDGFEKPRDRCRIAAAGIRTRAPQRLLASSGRWSSMWVLSASLPAAAGFQRSLGSLDSTSHRPLNSSGRWVQFFSGSTDRCVPSSAGKKDLKSIEIIQNRPKSMHEICQTLLGVGRLHVESMNFINP
ncbi:transport/golgi organization-like protein [Perilla frutescens var. hirtella]|uniref:Transport/golgi organization-like protein n=1 Tax=Perilla frutescens var. hirtella TaxID=608512 RepID=A0AAD4JKX9_PERFH|nr:transport/golgi organization-like protein [Perilla frutescens var. hirtella]